MMTGILREIFPKQCGTAGKANVADIVSRRGKVNFVGLEHGSRLDLTEALTILTAAVTLLAKVLEVVKALPAKKDEKPDSLAVEVTARIPVELLEKLPPEDARKIILAMLNRADGSNALPAQRDQAASKGGSDD